MAYSATMRALLKGMGYSDAEINAMEAQAAAATTKKTTTAKTPITKTYYPQVYSPTQARSFINDQFQSLFKRAATPAEVTKYTKLLKSAQEAKKNAAVQEYKATGSTAVSGTTTGLDEAQWLLEEIQKDKTLAAEYQSVLTTAPDVTKLKADKKIYDDLINKAAGDLEKIKAAKESTTYGRLLGKIEASIGTMVANKGAINDPGEISKIAQELVDKGLDLNSDLGKSIVESRLKFGKGKITVGGKTTDMYTGEAGGNVQALNKIALANGLNLNQVFDDATLPEVLNAINAGEDINTYAKIVRDAAKVAWNVPDNVAKLMDQGVSLDAIYAPYKNTFASTLELNPNDVTLNDLAKFGIIGQPSADKQTPQNLYDFQRALRKDERWQYTQEAHQEVASGVQKVLKDFGFMG